jgi:hypothetical protein
MIKGRENDFLITACATFLYDFKYSWRFFAKNFESFAVNRKYISCNCRIKFIRMDLCGLI